MLPVELLQGLNCRVPCREQQLGQLATLYNVSFESFCGDPFYLTNVTTEALPPPTSPRCLRPRRMWPKCRGRSCVRSKADPMRYR